MQLTELQEWACIGAALLFGLLAVWQSYRAQKFKERSARDRDACGTLALVMRTAADINAWRARDLAMKERDEETMKALRRGVDPRRDALWNWE